MTTIEIHQECYCCGLPTLTLHTEAEQHENGPWDFYCNDEDEARCSACGFLHRISLDPEGMASVVWDETSPDNLKAWTRWHGEDEEE